MTTIFVKTEPGTGYYSAFEYCFAKSIAAQRATSADMQCWGQPSPYSSLNRAAGCCHTWTHSSRKLACKRKLHMHYVQGSVWLVKVAPVIIL